MSFYYPHFLTLDQWKTLDPLWFISLRLGQCLLSGSDGSVRKRKIHESYFSSL